MYVVISSILFVLLLLNVWSFSFSMQIYHYFGHDNKFEELLGLQIQYISGLSFIHFFRKKTLVA